MEAGLGDEAATGALDLGRQRLELSQFLGAKLDIQVVCASIQGCPCDANRVVGDRRSDQQQVDPA